MIAKNNIFLLFAIYLSNVNCNFVYDFESNARELEDDPIYGTFSDDFLWATATASYQIEGGWNESYKAPSIWDSNSHACALHDCDTGDVACDSFHLWRTDIKNLQDLGVNSYRFSISWGRLFYDGTPGKIDYNGYLYYNDLIDGLVAANITPMVTMFHWDLPQYIQDTGGWMNPDIQDMFYYYADFLYYAYGDRVKYWMTVNEPLSFAVNGYNGFFAPAVPPCGMVSMVIAIDDCRPKNNETENILAADRCFAWGAGVYMEPLIGSGNWPQIMIDTIAEKAAARNETSWLPKLSIAEQQHIQGTMDFFGVNIYTADMIASHPRGPSEEPSYSSDNDVDAFKDPSWPSSASAWLKLTPNAVTNSLKYIASFDRNIEILITECGWSNYPEDSLDDSGRQNFYNKYLRKALQSYQDGINLKGFTAWALMDNLEWKAAFSERFGLYYTNFTDPDRERIPKVSASVYSKIISDNGFPYVNITTSTRGTTSSQTSSTPTGTTTTGTTPTGTTATGTTPTGTTPTGTTPTGTTPTGTTPTGSTATGTTSTGTTPTGTTPTGTIPTGTTPTGTTATGTTPTGTTPTSTTPTGTTPTGTTPTGTTATGTTATGTTPTGTTPTGTTATGTTATGTTATGTTATGTTPTGTTPTGTTPTGTTPTGTTPTGTTPTGTTPTGTTPTGTTPTGTTATGTTPTGTTRTGSTATGTSPTGTTPTGTTPTGTTPTGTTATGTTPTGTTPTGTTPTGTTPTGTTPTGTTPTGTTPTGTTPTGTTPTGTTPTGTTPTGTTATGTTPTGTTATGTTATGTTPTGTTATGTSPTGTTPTGTTPTGTTPTGTTPTGTTATGTTPTGTTATGTTATGTTATGTTATGTTPTGTTPTGTTPTATTPTGTSPTGTTPTGSTKNTGTTPTTVTTSSIMTTTHHGGNCSCPPSEYTGPSGIIRSPNYPKPYCNDGSCSYKITVATGKIVALRLIGKLEPTVFSAVSRDSVTIGQTACPSVTGLPLENSFDRTFYSVDNTISFSFQSNGTGTDIGFIGSWTAIHKLKNIRRQTIMSLVTKTHILPDSTSHSSRSESEIGASQQSAKFDGLTYSETGQVDVVLMKRKTNCSCGPRFYGGPFGVIQLPSTLTPNTDYCNNMRCSYQVSVQPGMIIQMRLIGHTEPADNIAVFDTVCRFYNNPIIGGYDFDHVLQSDTNTMGVSFNSNDKITNSGFIIYYQAQITPPAPPPPLPPVTTPHDCKCPPVEVFGSIGVIRSPNEPYDYCPNLNCKYHVTAAPGAVLKLMIRGETYYDFDIVTVFNTTHGVRKLSGYFYDHLYTTDNELIVQFTTDSVGAKYGFYGFYQPCYEQPDGSYMCHLEDDFVEQFIEHSWILRN